MADSFRDTKLFALFNVETLTVLDYSFRDNKCFALLNLETNYPELLI